MRENTLTELQGTSILTKSFFNKLIRRIEATKPLAGEGTTITETDNGFQISSQIQPQIQPQISAVTYALNVCLAGSPTTIIVYGPKP